MEKDKATRSASGRGSDLESGSSHAETVSANATEKGKSKAIKKKLTRTERTPPPQSTPREWKWKCHLCQSTYRLGVTNRCLKDSHYFCFGKSTNGVNGEARKGRVCTSYVDSNGWRKRNGYRKLVRSLKGIEHSPGCWEDCYYPGMCHNDTDSRASVDTRQQRLKSSQQKEVPKDQDMAESINPAVKIQTARKELWNPTVRSTAEGRTARTRKRSMGKRVFLQVLDKTASRIQTL